MAEATAPATSPGLGQYFSGLLNKGLDVAAAYATTKLQTDAQVKAAKAGAAPATSATAASSAAAAGSATPAAPSTMPSWVKPVAIGGGVLVALALVWKLLAGSRN